MKVCNGCKEEKPEDEFWFNAKTQRRIARCTTCESAAKKAYKQANREKMREADRKWREANREKAREAHDRWKARNPGLAAERTREWRERNLEHVRQRERATNRAIKDQVFEAYGGYTCACCGETERDFLTLDHINNDGAKHRRELFGGQVAGRKIYAWAIANNFPSVFQVLCMNCNWGKARNNGVCPHKTSEGSTTIPKGSRAKRSEARSPLGNEG